MFLELGAASGYILTMLRKMAFAALVAICTISAPAFFYLMVSGITSLWDQWGLVWGSVIVVLALPVFAGVALLIDGREARDRQHQRDQLH